MNLYCTIKIMLTSKQTFQTNANQQIPAYFYMHIHIVLHLTPDGNGMCNLMGAIMEIAVHHSNVAPAWMTVQKDTCWTALCVTVLGDCESLSSWRTCWSPCSSGCHSILENTKIFSITNTTITIYSDRREMVECKWSLDQTVWIQTPSEQSDGLGCISSRVQVHFHKCYKM